MRERDVTAQHVLWVSLEVGQDLSLGMCVVALPLLLITVPLTHASSALHQLAAAS